MFPYRLAVGPARRGRQTGSSTVGRTLGDAPPQELSRRARAIVVQRDAIPPEGLVSPACTPQQIGADRGRSVRPGQSGVVGHLVQRRQAGREPVAETDRQRAVRPGNGGIGDLDQPVVGQRRSPPSRSAANSAPSRVSPRSPPAADTDPSRPRPAAAGPAPARFGHGPIGCDPVHRAAPAPRRRPLGSAVANHAAGQGRPAPAHRARQASTSTVHRPGARPHRTVRRGWPTVLPSTSSPR